MSGSPSIYQIFDPYNLYAKAFPGIIFFILTLSVLPKDSLNPVFNSGTLFAGLILLVVVLGFVLGQAIHSISSFVETTIYGYLRSIYVIYKSIRQKVLSTQPNEGAANHSTEDFGLSTWLRILSPPMITVAVTIITGNLIPLAGLVIGAVSGLLGPVERIRLWFQSVLTPHREMFQQKYYDSGRLSKSFRSVVSTERPYPTADSPEQVYTSVMSRLEFERAGRARLFQAIYSLSRSLWIILISFSILYLIMGLSIKPPEFLPPVIKNVLLAINSYQPSVSNIAGENTGLILFGISLVIFSLLFMRSEAKYKKLFIEYVMVDYLNLIEPD